VNEEWISLNEYMKRNKIGYETALHLIYEQKVDCQKTKGGRYKIKVGGDTVSRELYERTLARAIEAETKLANARAILA